MAVIIIEGVVATGKTTLVNALTQHPAWSSKPTRSVISEHYTERVLELTSPTVTDRVQLLEQHMIHIRTTNELYKKYRFYGEHALVPVTLLERFHLTHAAQVGDFTPFVAIDNELSHLGAALVFIYHPRPLLLRHILDTSKRNPLWQRWLRSLGTESQIEDYFWRLQENTKIFVSYSRARIKMIEAYSQTPQELAEEVLAFSRIT
ncbi:MAG: Uncharacterized protein FD169_2134 [Bacillota bacterium]|nr:MAG: Uncharacterized protein FD169_2134 [Bacillota bacterium]MBS3949248.1 hypothetical protein [Peptococcaceae bacterium]